MLYTTAEKGLKGANFGRNTSVSMERSSPLTGFLSVRSMIYESEATSLNKTFRVKKFA